MASQQVFWRDTVDVAGGKEPTTAEKAAKTKDKVAKGAGAAKEYATETGSPGAHKTTEAKHKVVGSTYSTVHYVAEKGTAAEDTVLEKGQHGIANAKDTVMNTAAMAKDYNVPKVVEAKDKTEETTQGVVGYAGEKVAHRWKRWRQPRRRWSRQGSMQGRLPQI
ncbi:hypothetical protein MLD38_033313 [Melastoma candidum]|uniref:Uncharacterized protein n=1 Tax=Melastoma candidum TaxID=119954 RepID=A0ACB9M860_9MYRT|nr:hypothetical protein MLD38_033313 [Melastoma candidum]